MSAILGWTGSTLDLRDWETRAQQGVTHRAGMRLPRMLAGERCAVGSSSPHEDHLARIDGLAIAACGDPGWRPEPLRSLHRERGFAHSVAIAYREHGSGLLQRLSGAFSLAVIDEATSAALIAIDRMGVHGLRYCVADGTFLFGSSFDLINLHPAARPEIDPQGIFDYLYFHMVPAPGSIYRDRRQLTPGGQVRFSDGAVREGRYWDMEFPVDAGADLGELEREFNLILRNAVRARSGAGGAGAFLSGGTDSSTVSGLLCEIQGAPAQTYSIGFDAAGFDETEYAHIASRHFGTRHRDYYLTPADLAAAIPLIAMVYDQPFGNASAVPTYYCARMAREDGLRCVFGGDGGDELFGGNARYAKQLLFAAWGRLPTPLRRGFLEPVLMNLPGGDSVPLLAKARSYVRQARIPMPDRLETYNLVNHFGPSTLFSSDFLAWVDTGSPTRLNREIYDGARADDMINRMLALDFRVTLADSDLPKVTRMCEAAGIEVAFPLLDDDLVEFSGRLAPDLKVRGNTLRWFFKHALREFLPPEIIAKRKHGFGLPFGVWLGSDRELREMTIGALSDFRKRGILDPAFMDRLLDNYLHRHASYYGTMIWLVMMLELWLRERAQDWRR